jgi:hypothetical protein
MGLKFSKLRSKTVFEKSSFLVLAHFTLKFPKSPFSRLGEQ